MLSFFLPHILESIASAGLGLLLKEVEKEYRRWASTREEIELEIKRQRDEIAFYLNNAQQHYDYKTMINLHYESFMVADQAYLLLKDARKSINALNSTLFGSKEKKTELSLKMKKYKSIEEKNEISTELKELGNLRKTLFDDRNVLKEQQEEFYKQVKGLNQQTHRLKIAIRDNTGLHGREWYQRLEERQK